MNKKEAYQKGKERGEAIVEYMEDLPTDYDEAITEAYQIEENDRQFSPFEFTAQELNSAQYPDELWDKFEEGISDGIENAINKRIRQ